MEKSRAKVSPPVATPVEATSNIDNALLRVFGSPPIVHGELPDDFNALFEGVRAAVRPRDVIEELLVRDFVEQDWEARRLCRIKTQYLNAFASRGVRRALESLSIDSELCDSMAWSYVRGHRVKSTNRTLGVKDGREAPIAAFTFVDRLDVINAIDSFLARIESRRDNTLLMIERRRSELARRLRTTAADVIDVEVSPSMVEPDHDE